MKIYIKAFANRQKEIYRMLESKSSVVLEHIAKLMMCPNHSDVNHWKQEIFAALSRVPKMKSSNKYPSSNEILKHTWNIWYDSLLDMVKAIADEYDVKLDKKTARQIYTSSHEYLTWLSDNLSLSGYVTRTKVYNELDKLLK